MRRREAPSSALWNVGWRTLLRHPVQTALMVLGIVLGVAVVVSIDLANESASRAFDLSVDSVAGRATHRIEGGPNGIPAAVYADLRAGIPAASAAPVVTETVYAPALDDGPLTLLGVDPFAEAPFRSYLAAEGGVPLEELTVFLTTPGAVLLSADRAEQAGLAVGDTFTLQVGGRERDAILAGVLLPEDSLSRRTLNGLVLADIATAQELTGRDALDRIDLLLPPGEAGERLAAEIEAGLPGGLRVAPVAARTGAIEQITAAFRTNLLALSLLALVVGMFLIYNTMTFSVVQRRPLFGTLRALGVTRREVFGMVVGEALIVGVVGAALGVALGVLLGQGALRLVTRTINDLFFTVSVRGVQVPLISLAKGLALGVGATVLSAALPAWEAANVPPRAALTRSTIEATAGRAVRLAARGGVALGLAGVAALLVPSRGLLLSFVGTFMVIVAAAFVTPLLMKGMLRAFTPLTARLWGVLGRMAPRAVAGALSRTSIAVAALMVSVSVTIGISLMVSSFRHTVEVWLGQTLIGDVYLSVPGATQTSPTTVVDPAVVPRLADWPGVERVDTVRSAQVDSPDGLVNLLAVNNPDSGQARQYLAADAPPDEIWALVEDGAVMVSEPFARRRGIPREGGSVTLYTPQGERTFPVVGIYYDYGSTEGQVMIAQSVYRELWADDAVTAVALLLADGADPDAVANAVGAALADVQLLDVRPNQALRDEVLVIFDQTFAITGALNVLATVVAFIGVLSALLSLQLEKQRELGILRAIGLTVRQLWSLTLIETGLMGTIAGLLAMPTGLALALILVYIINRRAFGWTLQLQVAAGPFVMALAVAVIAALLAGLLPARRISRMAAADAIRFE